MGFWSKLVGVCVVGVVWVAGGGAPVVMADSAFTWTGAGPRVHVSSSPGVGWDAGLWSDPANWGEGVPSGTGGSLTFPALPIGLCPGSPAETSHGCGSVGIDVSGVGASGLTIDTAEGYDFFGNGIAVGAGGITAMPDGGPADVHGGVVFEVPLTVTASQRWTIKGGTPGPVEFAANVTGHAHGVDVALSDGGVLALGHAYGGAVDVEVGPIHAGGDGTIDVGSPAMLYGGYPDTVSDPGDAGHLNGTDSQPVMVGAGTNLAVLGPGSTIGPLTVDHGQVSVGYGALGVAPVTAAVDGGVTLGSGSTLRLAFVPTFFGAGGAARLTASGDVALGGARLMLGTGAACQDFTVGESYTLVSTTAALTGTFIGVANGATVPVDCRPGSPATVTISYTPHAVIATVASTGSVATSGVIDNGVSSLTGASLVTNQVIPLVAHVDGAPVPADYGAPTGIVNGDVAFTNGGAPIPGCTNVPLTAMDFYGSFAECDTSFGAAGSPVQLTANFTPSGALALPSTTQTYSVPIGRGATASIIAASTTTPTTTDPVTVTATVTPELLGPIVPSGTVTFLDSDTVIPSCEAESLRSESGSSIATCQVTLPTVGTHQITASYTGDPNFTGSNAPPVQINPAPSDSTTSPPARGRPTTGTSATTTPGRVVTSEPRSRALTLIYRHGRGIATTVRCTEGAIGCDVTSTITARADMRSPRPVVIGRANDVLGAGRTATFEIALNPAGRRLLAGRGRLTIRITVIVLTPSGQRAVTIRTLTLTAR